MTLEYREEDPEFKTIVMAQIQHLAIAAAKEGKFFSIQQIISMACDFCANKVRVLEEVTAVTQPAEQNAEQSKD